MSAIQGILELLFYLLRSEGPDLGPNCLQSYQQTTKVAASKKKANVRLGCVY